MALDMTLLDLVSAVSGHAGSEAELIVTVVYLVKKSGKAVTVPPVIQARLDDASAIPPEYPNAFIDTIQRWLGNA